MRAGVGLLVLVLGTTPAIAQPQNHHVTAAPAPVDAAVAVELAGSWSGRTIEPKTGWRATLLVPIAPASCGAATAPMIDVAWIARVDDHGAPAEHSTGETHARSWGAGLRATATWASADLRVGVFAEGTVGRTRVRPSDAMPLQRDRHWMAAVGVVGGTRSVQLVGDFGWLVTDAGAGRIGPIASLGFRVAFQ